MQILKKDLRNNTLTLKPENMDDLWLLEKILKPGDVVSGKSMRSIKIDRGDSSDKEKKLIFVKIAAEKIEFGGSQLRVLGRILEAGEEQSGHHAFEIVPEKAVTIERIWKKYDLDRIYAARTKHPPILLCAIDYDECAFAMLTERLEMLASIRAQGGKSYGSGDRSGYLSEIKKYMHEKSGSVYRIIIAGPGFAKEGLAKIIGEGEIAGKILYDSVSQAGEPGISEILRRGIVEKIFRDSGISEQTKLVESFFAEISKDGKIVYGIEETKQALHINAAQQLLISDCLVHKNEPLLEEAEKIGAEIRIIDSSHEAGQRFLQLCGIGAFLRFRIE